MDTDDKPLLVLPTFLCPKQQKEVTIFNIR